jgi:1-acyl-sn-glycerol-3-phosphate acyltransferase
MKYEEWSLGYWLLKQYVRFASWLIHKKTLVVGKENIPKDKPLIFAPNHQNALSDPMAVLLNTRYQPVWLGRADIFGKSKMIDRFLKFIKIIPVYRLRDGKENLDKNDNTFSTSIKVLKNNKALALFPEAAHTFKRQMLPHQKAVPRIAFMAEEQSGKQLDIQIIPTGIYYSHYWKFNRTQIVCFGIPIPVSNYMDSCRQNPNAAIIELKKELYDKIISLVININSKEYYHEFERIREIYGTHFLLQQKKKYSTLNLYNSDKILINKLDALESTDKNSLASVAFKVNTLFDKIKGLGLRGWLLNKEEKHSALLLIHTFLLIVLLPVFIIGFVFNAVPFFLIDRGIRKKVKDKSFWSTFFLVSGIIAFPLFYALELLAVSWLLPGILLKIVFLLCLPFAGKVAFKWYILLRKTVGRFRLLKLKWKNKTIYNQLLNEKEKLFAELDNLLFENNL